MKNTTKQVHIFWEIFGALIFLWLLGGLFYVGVIQPIQHRGEEAQQIVTPEYIDQQIQTAYFTIYNRNSFPKPSSLHVVVPLGLKNTGEYPLTVDILNKRSYLREINNSIFYPNAVSVIGKRTRLPLCQTLNAKFVEQDFNFCKGKRGHSVTLTANTSETLYLVYRVDEKENLNSNFQLRLREVFEDTGWDIDNLDYYSLPILELRDCRDYAPEDIRECIDKHSQK